jgi:uncharacterized membrane protein
VVAIAITLLVLPLADLGNQIGTSMVAALLRANTDEIFGFLLSFVVIARLWLAQHAIVRSLARQTTVIVGLMLAWTFTIVVLPFPTTLVTSTSDDPLAKVLYIGTMAVSSALLAVVARVIARDRSLRDSDDGPDPLQSTATTVTFVVALVVSLALPAAGYWPLFLLFLTDPVAHSIRRLVSGARS